MEADVIPFYKAYLICAAGVAVSVLLPLIRAAVPSAPGQPERFLARVRTVAYDAAKPYAAIALFSLMVSVLVLAVLQEQGQGITNWSEALLAGNVSDSTLQEFSAR